MTKTMKTKNKIQRICNKELTDFVEGSMSVEQVAKEITHQLRSRRPEYMVVFIEKNKDSSSYKTTLYVDKKEFIDYKP